jgi:hypothetical protein
MLYGSTGLAATNSAMAAALATNTTLKTLQ